jgi:hypothetical protein
LAVLRQILHSLVLNAWCTECNSTSLANYAKSGPTPQDLLDCARHIIGKYAVPSTDSVFEPTSLKAPLKDLQSRVVIKRPVTDIVHNNTALLTCDLLYVMELVDAIAYGDFGRVEDILPNIACMFRGSGSNNYSMEILHLIFNIKEVWTPTFAYVPFDSPHSSTDHKSQYHRSNIICDNALVNPSGIPGHAMGIDMNIEHLI